MSKANWKSPRWKMNKAEAKKSLRDSLLNVFVVAVIALLGELEGFDYNLFGETGMLIKALVTSFVVPYGNRWLNALRVK